MYGIYCIAYKISDEIKAQKEAEKPFWWDHIHPDVREQTLQQIEQELLQNGAVSPEKMAEMTKNEKFLVLSQGSYALELKSAGEAAKELESLKKEVERSKSMFLNQPMAATAALATGASAVQQQENIEPIVLGQPLPAEPAIPSGGVDSPAVNTNGIEFPSFGNPQEPSIKLDDEHLSVAASQVNDKDLKDSPFAGDINATKPTKAEVRRYAQSIVAATIKDINQKADQIPDDVSLSQADDLLKAVVDELKDIQSKQK